MPRILIVLLAATCSYGEEGLVAHYAFDEGEGAVARDASSLQHQAEIQGAKWVKSAGRIALEFDGQGGHVHCGHGARLGLRGTLTISAWVKPLRTPPLVPPEPTIIGDGPSTLAITYWRSRIHFYFAHWRHHLSAPALPGRWYHVVAVADGKEIALYLDGQRRTCRSLPEGTVIKNLGHFGIGGKPGGKNTFAGLVSDVRVYNRALSPTSHVRIDCCATCAWRTGRGNRQSRWTLRWVSTAGATASGPTRSSLHRTRRSRASRCTTSSALVRWV